MIMRTSVWLFTAPSGSTPAPRRVIDPQARGAEAVPMAQCPTAVPLRVVLDRVAMSPWPLRTWSRWVRVVYPPGWAGAESQALPPAAPPRGDPQPPTPLETPVFFDPRHGGVGNCLCSS